VAQTPDSEKNADAHPKPSGSRSPKRGAIPTPKAEIEKVGRYVPETDRAPDQPATEPVSPENIDHKE